jgi:hypothetical protein
MEERWRSTHAFHQYLRQLVVWFQLDARSPPPCGSIGQPDPGAHLTLPLVGSAPGQQRVGGPLSGTTTATCSKTGSDSRRVWPCFAFERRNRGHTSHQACLDGGSA